MLRRTELLVLFLLLWLLPSCSLANDISFYPTLFPPNTTVFPQLDTNEAGRLVIEGINSARAQQNLVLLRADVTLTRIATARSADMIARDYFSHYDPQSGQEPLLRLIQVSHYAYQYAGENIAEIKNDAGWVPPLLTVGARYTATDLAEEFVTGWLNSPEHRANILNMHYRRTGVAIAVSEDGRRIVCTQVFSD